MLKIYSLHPVIGGRWFESDPRRMIEPTKIFNLKQKRYKSYLKFKLGHLKIHPCKRSRTRYLDETLCPLMGAVPVGEGDLNAIDITYDEPGITFLN